MYINIFRHFSKQDNFVWMNLDQCRFANTDRLRTLLSTTLFSNVLANKKNILTLDSVIRDSGVTQRASDPK